jgi:hypothetical protein
MWQRGKSNVLVTQRRAFLPSYLCARTARAWKGCLLESKELKARKTLCDRASGESRWYPHTADESSPRALFAHSVFAKANEPLFARLELIYLETINKVIQILQYIMKFLILVVSN